MKAKAPTDIWNGVRNFSSAAGYIIKIMKSKLKLFLLPALAAATIQFAPVVYAQPRGRQFMAERRARWAGLSEDERSKLKAAHRAAMADPAVRAAHDRLKQSRREFRDVMRPAMLKADPSVQPILEKMKAGRAKE